jgi:hypothetical protein
MPSDDDTQNPASPPPPPPPPPPIPDPTELLRTLKKSQDAERQALQTPEHTRKPEQK